MQIAEKLGATLCRMDNNYFYYSANICSPCCDREQPYCERGCSRSS